MISCPNCGLDNPDDAVSCDCLYDFRGNDGSSVVLTTAPTLEGFRITHHKGIVTAECVFGMSIFADLFASVRDVIGGRTKSTQRTLRSAREVCLRELRREAFSLHANAVIAVDLDYSEISGGGKSMLFLVASGTAVLVEALDHNP